MSNKHKFVNSSSIEHCDFEIEDEVEEETLFEPESTTLPLTDTLSDVVGDLSEKLFDQIFLSYIFGFAISITCFSTSIIDISMNISVLLLLEFFISSNSGSTKSASHKFRKGEFFVLISN